jgi:hypothetical protein
VEERFIDPVETIADFGYSGVQALPEALGLPLPSVPHIDNDRVEQTHVGGLNRPLNRIRPKVPYGSSRLHTIATSEVRLG